MVKGTRIGETRQGLSYGLAQVLLAGIAERFGAKRSLLIVILGFSCVSMAMGPLGGSLAVLIGLRLLLGLAESVHVPMMGVITARHFPSELRSRANASWNVGLIIATGRHFNPMRPSIAPWNSPRSA